MSITVRHLAIGRVRSILERRYRRNRIRRLLPSPLLQTLRSIKRALSRPASALQPATDEGQAAKSGSLVVTLPQFDGIFELRAGNALSRQLLDGIFESHIAEVFRAAISAGDQVVDVGANLGIYTVLAGKCVGPTGRVLAVEPTPSMIQLLDSNIERNSLANVTVFPGVVSDRVGTCSLEFVAGGEQYSSIDAIAHPDVPAGSRQKITVASETLDSLVSRFDLCPSAIKVDTEGAEALVFSQASETLKKHRPILFSELDQRLLAAHGGSARAVADGWFAFDYEVFNAATGEQYLPPHFPEDFIGDIVALPRLH
jgi:FkbM family methyltransferase